MRKTPLQKIAVEKSTRRHSSRREHARPALVRRATNEEIMHRSFLERGFIRLRWQPSILMADSGSYVGVHGAAIAVDFPDVKSAKEFVEHIRQAIRKEALLSPGTP